jgi:hypothetical protein
MTFLPPKGRRKEAQCHLGLAHQTDRKEEKLKRGESDRKNKKGESEREERGEKKKEEKRTRRKRKRRRREEKNLQLGVKVNLQTRWLHGISAGAYRSLRKAGFVERKTEQKFRPFLHLSQLLTLS